MKYKKLTQSDKADVSTAVALLRFRTDKPNPSSRRGQEVHGAAGAVSPDSKLVQRVQSSNKGS